MKHLLNILLDEGYEVWRSSIIFPDQNSNSKTQNEYILKNKEKFNVIFTKGNDKKGNFFFKDDANFSDFSTMRVGGMCVYFIKDNDFEKKIIWGLYEGSKPPTLIHPKLNIEYKRIDCNNKI